MKAYMLKIRDGGSEVLVGIFKDLDDLQDTILEIQKMPAVRVREGTKESFMRFLKVGNRRVLDQQAEWFWEEVELHESVAPVEKMSSAQYYLEEDEAAGEDYF